MMLRNLLTIVLLTATSSISLAALLELEDFSTGTGGWGDRDSGEMSVGYAAGTGNPAGSVSGSFADGVLTPETDAFRLASGPFMGDVMDGYPDYNPTYWAFDFYAENVVPSDMIMRIGSGSSSFSRSLTAQVNGGAGSWYTVTAPVTYSGWFGGSQAAFDATMSNLQYIELQLTRNGDDYQTYYIDNFQLQGDYEGEGGGGGDPSAVPEPQTISIMFATGLMLFFARRRTFNG